MKNILRIFLYCSFALLLLSCGGKKKKTSQYISDVNMDISNSELVEVPYKEDCGVKFIHVKVNGIGWDMILDTGCSGTLLSLSEARYMAEKGLLVQQDVLGTSQSQIADGSIVENTVVRLKHVSIIASDDRTIDCYNVIATVSNNINAPLLLGNEVLDEVAYDYTIDNSRKVISFNVK